MPSKTTKKKSQAKPTKPAPTKKSTGRKCSICFHEKAEQINSRIAEGKSFRYISLHFGMSAMSVQRHTEKCLKLEIAALKIEIQQKNAIDYHKELNELFQFVKKAYRAANQWLTDPNNPDEFTLAPRSVEMEIVYSIPGIDDLPVRVKQPLQRIIDMLHDKQPDWAVETVFVKSVDLRDYSLKIVDKADVVLDKYAKIQGLYQQDRQNETDAEFARIKKVIESAVDKFGTDYKTELDIFLNNYADQVRPDLKEKLISEMVN